MAPDVVLEESCVTRGSGYNTHYMSFIRKRRKGDAVYLEEVESKRVNGRVVQKHIRYIGKEANGKTVLAASLSEVSVEQVKLHGPLLILNHLATDVGLDVCLGRYANEILSMVYAHCLDYQSVNQMSRWFERTDLMDPLILGWSNSA